MGEQNKRCGLKDASENLVKAVTNSLCEPIQTKEAQDYTEKDDKKSKICKSQSVSIDGKKKPFQCSQCRYAFSYQSKLNIHMRGILVKLVIHPFWGSIFEFSRSNYLCGVFSTGSDPHP